MKLETFLLDIDSISFTQKNEYSPELIETLANLILEQGGNSELIVVKRVKIDEYELVSGEIILLAAIAAQKKDRYFEMVRTLIEQEGQDLAKERKLVEEIKTTAKSIEITSNETIEKESINETKEDTNSMVVEEPKIEKKTPVKDGKWLIVEKEIVDYGDYRGMLDIKEKMYENNPNIEVEILTVADLDDLLSKKKWYLEKLAQVQRQLDAYEKFLNYK